MKNLLFPALYANLSFLNPNTILTSQRGAILSDNLFCKQENSRNYTAFICSALLSLRANDLNQRFL